MNAVKVTLAWLISYVGSLGNPSKMPGYSWGIPAKHCKRGSKLRKVANSVCSKCYALKGNYVRPNVQQALQNRLDKFNELPREEWCEHMAALIHRKVNLADPYFRVFDSGDLLSEEMVIRWWRVATLLPEVKFWLATRERGIVNKAMKRLDLKKPDNLIIRVSSDMIAQDSVRGQSHRSGVAPRSSKEQWTTLVDENTNERFHCPSSLQDGKCGNCRACWSPEVELVLYLQH